MIESIIANHPFVDGNKRAGYVLMRLSLLGAGYDISASEEEKYSFVMSIASGQLNTENIRIWLQEHVILKR